LLAEKEAYFFFFTAFFAAFAGAFFAGAFFAAFFAFLATVLPPKNIGEFEL
jgi:hypothetical protein